MALLEAIRDLLGLDNPDEDWDIVARRTDSLIKRLIEAGLLVDLAQLDESRRDTLLLSGVLEASNRNTHLMRLLVGRVTTLEERVMELTEAVAAQAVQIQAHGAALAAAVGRVEEDVAYLKTRLDEALGHDAEVAAAVARINDNTGLIGESTTALQALDPDPTFPLPPPPEPTADSTPPEPADGGLGDGPPSE